MSDNDGPRYPQGWLEQLPLELTRWQQAGLVSAEQAASIRALYPAPERTGSRLTRTLTVMAAILIGLGVILFVAAHWESMDRWLKVALLLAAMLGSYGSGYFLAYTRGNYPRVGQALILLGCLVYGADIFLIAQIFHLQAHYPNGMLVWALGVLAVAWATPEELTLALAAVLLAIWTGMEQGGFERLNLWYLILDGALVLPLAWRLRSRWSLALALLGGGVWWVVAAASNFGHEPGRGGTATLVAALIGLVLWGTTLFAGAALTPEWAAMPQRLTGGTMLLIGLFGLSFAELVKRADMPASTLSLAARLGSGVLLLGALSAAALAARREKWEGLGAAVIALLAAALWLLPGSAWLALPTNVALLLAIGGVMVAGYRTRTTALLILALVAFGADVIGRYFDFFWQTLDRSLFFLVGGILLLGIGALLERQGRRLGRGWGEGEGDG